MIIMHLFSFARLWRSVFRVFCPFFRVSLYLLSGQPQVVTHQKSSRALHVPFIQSKSRRLMFVHRLPVQSRTFAPMFSAGFEAQSLKRAAQQKICVSSEKI
jgi:hypothetical protein